MVKPVNQYPLAFAAVGYYFIKIDSEKARAQLKGQGVSRLTREVFPVKSGRGGRIPPPRCRCRPRPVRDAVRDAVARDAVAQNAVQVGCRYAPARDAVRDARVVLRGARSPARSLAARDALAAAARVVVCGAPAGVDGVPRRRCRCRP